MPKSGILVLLLLDVRADLARVFGQERGLLSLRRFDPEAEVPVDRFQQLVVRVVVHVR